MANNVDIILNATDKASAAINGVDQSLSKMESTGKNTGFSMTELTSTFAMAERALGYLQGAYNQTVGVAMEYAQSVRDLSNISGESAENTSRFIQVLDDYQLSAQDAETATKALTKNGLAPNIDTLAKLSDEYLALNTIEDRNTFILKNLGKGGLEWANVLKQGSAAIRDQADAIEDGLILNDEQIAQAEKLRLTQDALSDSVEALKIKLGASLLPAVNDVARAFLNAEDKGTNWVEFIAGTLNPVAQLAIYIRDLKDAHEDNEEITLAAADALDKEAQSAEELAEQERMLAEAIKETTASNKDYLKLVEDVTKQQTDYEKKVEDFASKRKELEDELSKLRKQGYWEQSEQIQGTIKKLDDLNKAEQEAAAEFELAGKRRILSMLEVRLAEEGLSNAEMQYLLDLGLQWGIYSETAVEEAERAMRAVDKLSQSILMMPDGKIIRIDFQAPATPWQSYEDMYSNPPAAPATPTPETGGGGGTGPIVSPTAMATKGGGAGDVMMVSLTAASIADIARAVQSESAKVG